MTGFQFNYWYRLNEFKVAGLRDHNHEPQTMGIAGGLKMRNVFVSFIETLSIAPVCFGVE